MGVSRLGCEIVIVPGPFPTTDLRDGGTTVSVPTPSVFSVLTLSFFISVGVGPGVSTPPPSHSRGSRLLGRRHVPGSGVEWVETQCVSTGREEGGEGEGVRRSGVETRSRKVMSGEERSREWDGRTGRGREERNRGWDGREGRGREERRREE